MFHSVNSYISPASFSHKLFLKQILIGKLETLQHALKRNFSLTMKYENYEKDANKDIPSELCFSFSFHLDGISNLWINFFFQFIVVSLKDGMFNNANVLFKTKFVDGVSTVTRYAQKESQPAITSTSSSRSSKNTTSKKDKTKSKRQQIDPLTEVNWVELTFNKNRWLCLWWLHIMFSSFLVSWCASLETLNLENRMF